MALDLLVCQACSQVKIFFSSLGSEIDWTGILVLINYYFGYLYPKLLTHIFLEVSCIYTRLTVAAAVTFLRLP